MIRFGGPPWWIRIKWNLDNPYSLYSRLINKMLDRGHHRIVYKISIYFGSLGGIKNPRLLDLYVASWLIQDRLIKEFGYHECPSCRWATKNHRGCGGEYCRENILRWEESERDSFEDW